MPPGSSIALHSDRPASRTEFIAREKTPVINSIPKNPIITVRTGFYVNNAVAVVAVMFDIGSNTHAPFETWLNYHESGDDVKKQFHDLASQPTITFHIYGDSLTCERSISINNSIKGFFQSITPQITELPPWRMNQFDAARELLYLSHPTTNSLWEALFMKSNGN